MNTPDFGGAVTDCASLAAFNGNNLCDNAVYGPKCCASCARQHDCVDSPDADVIAKLKEGYHYDFGAKSCESLLTYNGGSLCNDPEYKPYCCATCKALLPSAPPPSPPPSASPSPPPPPPPPGLPSPTPAPAAEELPAAAAALTTTAVVGIAVGGAVVGACAVGVAVLVCCMARRRRLPAKLTTTAVKAELEKSNFA